MAGQWLKCQLYLYRKIDLNQHFKSDRFGAQIGQLDAMAEMHRILQGVSK